MKQTLKKRNPSFGIIFSLFLLLSVFSTFNLTAQNSTKVSGTVTDANGCIDTISILVVVLSTICEEPYLFMPNAFTPNSDDVNDGFIGTGKLDGAKDFHFTIWNRWGELLFQTHDPTEGWNGRIHNSGNLAQGGVYMCVVTYNGPRGDEYKIKGFATLIR